VRRKFSKGRRISEEEGGIRFGITWRMFVK
jgi:hypothetical protein